MLLSSNGNGPLKTVPFQEEEGGAVRSNAFGHRAAGSRTKVVIFSLKSKAARTIGLCRAPSDKVKFCFLFASFLQILLFIKMV